MPDTISTCAPSVRPMLHGASLGLSAARDEHRRLLALANNRRGRNQDDVAVLLRVDVDLHGRADGKVHRPDESEADGTVAVPASTAVGRESTFSATSGASVGAFTR